jgi:DNA-binding winged helix-turn-helix (wHTH) protein/tetratricopeptide (TPR) repeat protein
MIYRLSDFELDSRLFELRRGGVPVKLEPRVYDVLAFLIAHRDRVVTMRELHEALWPGEFVTDSAVTRCIREARRALGDTGDEQRAIRTVHGRGYRFVADVVELREHTGSRAADGGRAPARRGGMVVAAMGVIAACAALALIWVRAGSSDALAARRTLAIVPEVSDPSDADLQLLALSVADLLDKRLSQVPGLVLRPPAYSGIGHAASEPIVPPGATHVVEATLSRSADRLKGQLAVNLRYADGRRSASSTAIQARSTPLGVYDLPFLGPGTDLTSFTRVRDAIVSRLVGVLLPAIDLPGAESVRPRDPQAFRLYLLAASRIAQTVICDQGALELVKQSLELDPEYAPSWVLLGWAHDNQATACAQDGSHYRFAMAAAERAAKLAPDLAASTPLRAAILVETGRVEEAYELARKALERFPSSPDVRYAQVYALTYAGFTDAARRELDRVLELDPGYLTAGGWTPNVLLYERDWDRFLKLLPATETPLFRFYRGYAMFQKGQRVEAGEVVSPSFRQNPHDVFARFGQALTAIVGGQPAEAIAQIRQLARQRAELGSGDGEVTYKQAQLLAIAGDGDGSLDELSRAVRQGFFCTRCFEQDRALDGVREADAFRAAFSIALERHRAFGARFGLPPQ